MDEMQMMLGNSMKPTFEVPARLNPEVESLTLGDKLQMTIMGKVISKGEDGISIKVKNVFFDKPRRSYA